MLLRDLTAAETWRRPPQLPRVVSSATSRRRRLGAGSRERGVEAGNPRAEGHPWTSDAASPERNQTPRRCR